MRRTYKYRIYGNKETLAHAERTIEICRIIYNNAIAERREYFEQIKKLDEGKLMHQPFLYYNKDGTVKRYIGYFDQCAMVTHKGHEHLKEYDSGCLCAALQRTDGAYKSYFDLIKKYKKKQLAMLPKPPHFVKKGQYHSFTYKKNGWKIDGERLVLAKVGVFRIKLHREIKGDIKTVTVKKEPGNKWFVCFSCDNVPQNLLAKTGKTVGLDMGLTRFVTDSDGGFTPPPKFFEQSERKMRRLQRALSRCKKGSNRRLKAKENIAKLHRKIHEQRQYFVKCVAKPYIERNDLIAVEDLNIKEMVDGSYLAKRINDAAWKAFLDWLAVKSEETGREILRVDPAYTSQKCSACGHTEKENRQSQAKFVCEKCGYVDNADVNAAKNIGAHVEPAGAKLCGCTDLSANYAVTGG